MAQTFGDTDPSETRIAHTARITAASAITLPRAGMYLARVRVFGGSTPGNFSVLYNGIASAQFPVPSDTTRGYSAYEVNWLVNGTQLPAALFTLSTGVSAVELHFALEEPSANPQMREYRGEFARNAPGAGGSTTRTLTYAEGPATPKKAMAYGSAAGRFTFPANGGFTFQVEALLGNRTHYSLPLPVYEEANTLAVTEVADAAGTFLLVVYY